MISVNDDDGCQQINESLTNRAYRLCCFQEKKTATTTILTRFDNPKKKIERMMTNNQKKIF